MLIVLLASELPDPGAPSFATLCGGYGGFLGLLIGLGRRLPWKRIAPLMAQGSAVGYSVGFVVWAVAFAIDRL
ncbi:MAG TPA: hypothetical protein VN635_09690 [Conexibacter sp.]|nr:hypothetical protein [Conexibacter sp.]